MIRKAVGVPRAFPSAVILLVGCAGFLVGSCRLVPGRGPASPALESGEASTSEGVVYQGTLSLDGGDLHAALEIVETGGRRVRAALQTSSGLLADGDGRLRGRNLRLELSYGGECPGTMVLDGIWAEEVQGYQGTVEARDCTGSASGTFHFSGA